MKKYLERFSLNVVERLPHWLYRPANLVPVACQTQVLSSLLNRLFVDALAEGEVDFLAEKTLALRVTDLPLSWMISLKNNKLQVAPCSGEGDATFAGDMNSLLLLASQKADPDTLFFRRKLSISGDTELGLEIKALIENLDLSTMPLPLRAGLNKHADLILASTSQDIQHGHH